MAEGIIFDIKEFAVHDGPGIRVTVFFKGCPLRCNWCHNPEGLAFEPELMIQTSSCVECGKCRIQCAHEACREFDRCLKACPRGLVSVVGRKIDAAVLAEQLKEYNAFLDMNDGGITLSGGEPLAQPEFLIALLEELKPLHTVVETSGHGAPDVFSKAVELSDMVLFDIKHMDTHVHRQHTGVGNELIQQNLQAMMKWGKPFIARIPLIPGVSDTDINLKETANVLKEATNLVRVELLPYNPFAGAKYASVAKEYQPKFEADAGLNSNCGIFEQQGISCKVL